VVADDGRLTVRGTPYAYLERGSGPLVLFGHGLLAGREMFRAQIDALAGNYRCVSIDWPGHGDSGHRAEGWTLYDLAEDTVEIVARLGGGPACLVGLSQGSMIFTRLALARPELVRALVVIGTSARPEDPAVAAEYHALAEILSDGTDEERANILPIVQQLLHSTAWLDSEPEAAERERERVLAFDRRGIRLAAEAAIDRDDVLDRLGEISAPTLVVVGDEDFATTPEEARAVHGAIDGSELVVIPGAGHHCAVDNPAAVSEALTGFLAGAVTRSA
jgi:pimeloyl-ACP methyl ester carboxylesterase